MDERSTRAMDLFMQQPASLLFFRVLSHCMRVIFKYSESNIRLQTRRILVRPPHLHLSLTLVLSDFLVYPPLLFNKLY